MARTDALGVQGSLFI